MNNIDMSTYGYLNIMPHTGTFTVMSVNVYSPYKYINEIKYHHENVGVSFETLVWLI